MDAPSDNENKQTTVEHAGSQIRLDRAQPTSNNAPATHVAGAKEIECNRFALTKQQSKPRPCSPQPFSSRFSPQQQMSDKKGLRSLEAHATYDQLSTKSRSMDANATSDQDEKTHSFPSRDAHATRSVPSKSMQGDSWKPTLRPSDEVELMDGKGADLEADATIDAPAPSLTWAGKLLLYTKQIEARAITHE